MVHLEDVLDENNKDDTVRQLVKLHGADPLTVLIEIENKQTVKNSLGVILNVLTPMQGQILLMITLGYSINAISYELNRDHSTIIGCKNSIAKRLFKIADEDRILALKDQLELLRSKGKTGRRYLKVLDEYNRRYAVREALKDLFVALRPVEYSTHSQPNSRPCYLGAGQTYQGGTR